MSNIHYLSPPLTVLQHHHIQQQSIQTGFFYKIKIIFISFLSLSLSKR